LAEAVAISLALDPEDRYQTAREMGRALSDGADGIAPAARPGGRAAPATEATSVLSAGRRAPAREPGRTAVTSAVTPRKPRSGPARAAPVAEPQAAPAARARQRGRNRLMFALLALLALALVIVAVVVITAPAPTQVKLRNVVYSDVQQAASALKQLVSENTK
jgi:hypothetical protein